MKRIAAALSTLVLFLFCAGLSTAHGQSKARIKGNVTDSSGGVLPNAIVTATNQDTGVAVNTAANSSGEYLFPQLSIGTYTISASAPGFKGFSASGIVLNLDQEYVEPIKLTIGAATDQVKVEADSVQVNTTDMQLNNIVNASQMVELPLIGRSFTSLELTLPGVQLPDTRFGGLFSVSGSQAQQSAFLVNGADTNDIALNTIALTPNLDAIDQFNLIDGPLNAEYDRNSGGIVSATIKQGTNHFHGDIFEFYRDTFLNTNNYFQKTFAQAIVNGVPTGPFLRTDKVSAYHQNIFGGTIGGPILKDKLFFFGAYQGTRQRVPQGTYNNTVYTPNNLKGDFSADAANGVFTTNTIPSTINIPGCAPGSTWVSCLGSGPGGTGGIVSPTAFNSIASALVTKYVPTATNGNFSYLSTSVTSQDQYIGRLDFSPSAKDRITVLGLYQKGSTLNGIPFTGASVPGFGDGSLQHIQQWTADYTRQLSSSAVNDLAAHYTRFNFKAGNPQTIVQPSSVGFSIIPQDAANSTIPFIAVNGGAPTGFSIGGTTNGPQPRIDQVIQLDDNFSKTFGHHDLKFGYDGRRFNVSNTFDASNSGAFSFGGGGGYSSGDPFLDLLIGVPDSYSQNTGAVIQADAFLNYFYAQDAWRVTNNLTINYGLGYSIDTPLRNHQFGGLAVACLVPGQQSKIFAGAPKSMNFPGDPGCSNSGQATTHHDEFGPRFGFAWAPDLGWISGGQGKFSIRGGFGIYYNRTEEESALQTLATPPFGFNSNGAQDFGGSPAFANPFADINGGLTTGTGGGAGSAKEANRFPYTEPVAGQAVDFSGVEPVYNISSFDSSFRAPYSENFQISVERELPSKMVTRVSYVGALGRHNQVDYEGNPVTPAGHAACVADPVCSSRSNRPLQAYLYPSHTMLNNPNFISIGEVGSYSSSNYNSLQVSITKAATHGLSGQISYTYAHSMDDASSFENAGFGEFGQRGYNQFQKSLNYGDSTFDTRHHFVIAPIYQTPLIKGHSPFSPISLALSGWEITGIAQFATGHPFDISYAGGTSNSLYCSYFIGFYACPDVPMQTAPLVKADLRTRLANGHTQFFQKSSFAPEPIGSFGNIHRNPYHGPGANNTNLILAKNFVLSSDGVIRLQLRMESDNVFNHTQFNNPTTTWNDRVPTLAGTSFGQVSSAAPARQTQLAAKIYF